MHGDGGVMATAAVVVVEVVVVVVVDVYRQDTSDLTDEHY